MNELRGLSLPRLLGALVGTSLGLAGHWLTIAGRAMLDRI